MAESPTRAALNTSSTGAGKTVQAVELSKALEAEVILVVGPVGKAHQDNWRNTFKGQGVDLPFRPINSSNDGARNAQDLVDRVPGVYHLGREYLGIVKRDLTYPLLKFKPDIAIVDECQFATNPKAQRTAGLMQLRNARYKLAMSATPQGNKFMGLWPLCRWLWWDRKDVADTSFHRWAAEWCEYGYQARGGGEGKMVPVREKNPGEFIKTLPCVVSVSADFKKPIEVHRVVLTLRKHQRKVYDDLEAKSLAWIKDEPLTATTPLTLQIRLRQAALGCPTVDPEDGSLSFDPECDSIKADALLRLCRKEWNGEKVLAFTSSRLFADALTERMNTRGVGALSYTGTLSQVDRHRNLQEFISKPASQVQLLVASIPSVAEGVDGLQTVCSREAWLDYDYNGMLVEQAEGRLNRRGQQEDKIVRYIFHAKETEDEGRFLKLSQQFKDNALSLRKEI